MGRLLWYTLMLEGWFKVNNCDRHLVADIVTRNGCGARNLIHRAGNILLHLFTNIMHIIYQYINLFYERLKVYTEKFYFCLRINSVPFKHCNIQFWYQLNWVFTRGCILVLMLDTSSMNDWLQAQNIILHFVLLYYSCKQFFFHMVHTRYDKLYHDTG